MGQIELTKMERHNTYIATCDILLNGSCIGVLEINYGYTPQNKLRIKSYSAILDPNGFWNHFEVDGRWETKASRGGKFCAEYDTFQTEYKTAKDAKSAALAFITQTLKG